MSFDGTLLVAWPNPCPGCANRIPAQRAGVKRAQAQSVKARALQSHGDTVGEIAEQLGVTVERTRKLLRPNGLWTRAPSPGRPAREFDAKRLRWMLDQGWPYKDIAEGLGCSIRQAYRLAKRIQAP